MIRKKLIEVTEVPQVDHDSNLNCQRDNKHPKEPAQITPDLVFSSNITAQPIIQTPIEVSDTNRMLRNNNQSLNLTREWEEEKVAPKSKLMKKKDKSRSAKKNKFNEHVNPAP